MADRDIIAVFGSMNMDLSVACERMPRAGETVGGSGFITNAGGKGANQAVAAARMGARTCMIGAVGRDTFGDALVAGLQDAGVGVESVTRLDDVETGTATIIRCESDNRIVLSPGANHALAGEDVARALRRLVADELDGDASEIAPAAGGVFIAQGECDLAATAGALACAHELGFYTIFNPAPACDLPAGAWPAVDLVCPNETECQVLTGILPTDDASCVAALNALLDKAPGLRSSRWAAPARLRSAMAVSRCACRRFRARWSIRRPRAIRLSARWRRLVWRACRSLSAWRRVLAPRR